MSSVNQKKSIFSLKPAALLLFLTFFGWMPPIFAEENLSDLTLSDQLQLPEGSPNLPPLLSNEILDSLGEGAFYDCGLLFDFEFDESTDSTSWKLRNLLLREARAEAAVVVRNVLQPTTVRLSSPAERQIAIEATQSALENIQRDPGLRNNSFVQQVVLRIETGLGYLLSGQNFSWSVIKNPDNANDKIAGTVKNNQIHLTIDAAPQNPQSPGPRGLFSIAYWNSVLNHEGGHKQDFEALPRSPGGGSVGGIPIFQSEEDSYLQQALVRVLAGDQYKKVKDKNGRLRPEKEVLSEKLNDPATSKKEKALAKSLLNVLAEDEEIVRNLRNGNIARAREIALKRHPLARKAIALEQERERRSPILRISDTPLLDRVRKTQAFLAPSSTIGSAPSIPELPTGAPATPPPGSERPDLILPPRSAQSPTTPLPPFIKRPGSTPTGAPPGSGGSPGTGSGGSGLPSAGLGGAADYRPDRPTGGGAPTPGSGPTPTPQGGDSGDGKSGEGGGGDQPAGGGSGQSSTGGGGEVTVRVLDESGNYLGGHSYIDPNASGPRTEIIQRGKEGDGKSGGDSGQSGGGDNSGGDSKGGDGGEGKGGGDAVTYTPPDSPTSDPATRQFYNWVNRFDRKPEKVRSTGGVGVTRPTEEGPITYSGTPRSGNVVVDPGPEPRATGSTRSPNAPPSSSRVTPQNVGTPIEQGMGHVYDVSDVRASRCADGIGGPQCNEFRETAPPSATPSRSGKTNIAGKKLTNTCVPPGNCQFGLVKSFRSVSDYACLAPPNDLNQSLTAFLDKVTVIRTDSGGSLCTKKDEFELCPNGYHFQSCWVASTASFGYSCQTNQGVVVCDEDQPPPTLVR